MLSDGTWIGDILWRDMKQDAMLPGYQGEDWFTILTTEEQLLVMSLVDKQTLSDTTTVDGTTW